MPGRGRSSFTKRQKEHTRQQKQRDKAAQHKQVDPETRAFLGCGCGARINHGLGVATPTSFKGGAQAANTFGINISRIEITVAPRAGGSLLSTF